MLWAFKQIKQLDYNQVCLDAVLVAGGQHILVTIGQHFQNEMNSFV